MLCVPLLIQGDGPVSAYYGTCPSSFLIFKFRRSFQSINQSIKSLSAATNTPPLLSHGICPAECGDIDIPRVLLVLYVITNIQYKHMAKHLAPCVKFIAAASLVIDHVLYSSRCISLDHAPTHTWILIYSCYEDGAKLDEASIHNNFSISEISAK